MGRPVRVQLTREQEHVWEPKGTAQLIDVKGGLNADGGVAGYDFATRYPSRVHHIVYLDAAYDFAAGRDVAVKAGLPVRAGPSPIER